MVVINYLLQKLWLDLTTSESRARDDWISTHTYLVLLKHRCGPLLQEVTLQALTKAIKAAVDSFTTNNNDNPPSPGDLSIVERRNPNRPRAGNNQSMTCINKRIGGKRLTGLCLQVLAETHTG